MKILHLIKTTDGARWALHQVQELQKKGFEIHVALPSLTTGRFVEEWKNCAVKLHEINLDFPIKKMWKYRQTLRNAQMLIDKVQPDIIHSHFVGTTLLLRKALGNRSIPTIFQVPGPLHLEHSFYRNLDLKSARKCDYWIASSKYTENLYLKYGVNRKRLFCSYYGWYQQNNNYKPIEQLRNKLNLPQGKYVVGNISYMYAPKKYLGQKYGVKRHELLIDALGILLENRQDVCGLLIGNAWAGKVAYEKKLQRRAAKYSKEILLPGYVSSEEFNSWELFDLAIHTPLSENCGGVVEPLLAGVPVIASHTGGLPEVVHHDKTGYIVDYNVNAQELAKAVNICLGNLDYYQKLAVCGKNWVQQNFDVRNTAQQISNIYHKLLT